MSELMRTFPATLGFQEVGQLAPLALVALFSLAVLLADVFARPGTKKSWVGYMTLVGLGVTFLACLVQWGAFQSATAGGAKIATIFFGTYRAEAFTVYFDMILILGAAITTLSAIGYFEEHGLHRGEFYSMMLMALFGMMLMAGAVDLLVFFVGLEVMSVAIYVLAAYQRHKISSIEAALKYFLMGAFSTAFLLLGMAYVYGATGTLNLSEIGDYAVKTGSSNLFLMLGMVLLLVGFAFKVSLVPFHQWTPDAYEGAPTVVTGFMATAVKAAAFAAFVRVFFMAFFPLKDGSIGWGNLIWVLAVLTMTTGNILALVQDNVKRMLAYSSVAHAGYLLLGLLAMDDPNGSGTAAILLYLLAYMVMNLGAFAVVVLVGRRENENLLVSEGWKGFGIRYPLLGAAMTLFMLSLAGVPPTAGFLGKFYLFRAALDQGFVAIVIIAVFNSLLSVYYYLRVTVYMFMVPAEDEEPKVLGSVPVMLAVLVSAGLTLAIGILPASYLESAQAAALSLLQ